MRKSMERQRATEVIKKGPWTAEEDEVLINFVNKHGPRDWSSIRSMGLLPRTGKSCRLRWVNKLRPNLKIGCKFTAEEERVVIELQARFGNKWATIASYLPGRTDNDVKNFWSTRQKRLARILQQPQPQPQPQPLRPARFQRNKGKVSSSALHGVQTLQVAEFSPTEITEAEESSSKCRQSSHSCSSSSFNGYPSDMIQQILPLPNLSTPDLIYGLDLSLPSLDMTPIIDHNQPLPHFPFTQLPYPKPGFQNLPEATALICTETDLLDIFATSAGQASEPQAMFGSQFLLGESTSINNEGMAGSITESEKLATPDGFFDDLPADIFDCLDPFPGSSSPQ